ncbi:MAG: Photosystem I assembly protein Ycf3 [Catillopecten margaritatus gill symbiont]|uniref:Photosystem I assembly protein Ycf3 n=1 Tax=Catillopecten margaritatus gill symbiont TaxID=3083288 RepID=A0AAU6PEZ2_9GAMM
MIDKIKQLIVANENALFVVLVGAIFGIIAFFIKRYVFKDNTNAILEKTVENITRDQEATKLEVEELKKSLAPVIKNQKFKKCLAEDNISCAVKALEQASNKDAIANKLALSALLYFTNAEESYRYLKEVIVLDPVNIHGLNQLGLLSQRMGKVEESIKYFQTILKNSNNQQHKGVALGNLGLAYARLGKVDKAIEYYQQALEISREIKDRQGEGSDLGNLGVAYADLGKVDKAIEYYQQALEISREIKDRQGEGNVLVI